MKRAFSRGLGIVALVVTLLMGCAPRTTQPTLPLSPLPAPEAQALLGVFLPTFQALGVRSVQAVGFVYQGEWTGTFEQIAQRFAKQAPGFCPLEQAFYVDEQEGVYMTVWAQRKEVRALIYDLSRRPSLRFMEIKGESRTALLTRYCRI